MSFTIMTDTSANLPEEFLLENKIKCIAYTFMIDGREPENFHFEGKAFYDDMRKGKIVTTSQIPPQRYSDFFREELEQGHDVLFISMSSGISGSFNSASIAAEDLREEFPDRKLRLVDALGASLGEGLLALWAVRYREFGLGVDAAAERLLDRRYGMCQVFTVDDLRYLKRGGRLSNLAAAVGTVLQIKPLLKGNNEGKIVCFEKVRGRKRAIEAMAEKFNEFALKLPAHRQTGLLAEEILGVVDAALLVAGHVLEIEGRYLEHLACTLGIGGCDQRGVEVDEALAVEILVDGEGHLAAQAVDGAEGVGAGTQVRDGPQVFEGRVLLLQRIAHRVAAAVDRDLLVLDLHGLAAAHGLHQPALHADAGARTDLSQHRLRVGVLVHDDLQVLDGRSVVECDERDLFVPSLRPDPTFGQNLLSCFHPEQVLHLGSKYFLHFDLWILKSSPR